MSDIPGPVDFAVRLADLSFACPGGKTGDVSSLGKLFEEIQIITHFNLLSPESGQVFFPPWKVL